jgi:hypothetical protein
MVLVSSQSSSVSTKEEEKKALLDIRDFIEEVIRFFACYFWTLSLNVCEVTLKVVLLIVHDGVIDVF